MNTISRRVLIVGFDPHSLPGIDAALIEAAMKMGQAKFDAEGIDVDHCLVRPDESAEPEIIAALTKADYAVVVIGGGVRKLDPTVQYLEMVISLIRKHAPNAAIAFNTNPTDSADAAKRWLDRT
jgi:hypothetical protein